jgi:hypothetical protein
MCLERFQTMVEPLKKAGVEVLNCSRKTALKAFPRVELEQALGLEPKVVRPFQHIAGPNDSVPSLPLQRTDRQDTAPAESTPSVTEAAP